MNNQEYLVDNLIHFFEAIPDSLWCVGGLTDDYGRHCAIGHCDSARCFSAIDLDVLCVNNYGEGAARINDGFHPGFPQATPKARILEALRFIKSKQQLPAPPALMLQPAWPVVAMQVKPVEKVEVV